MPAATVTTTVAVAYTANIGDTRRPRWSHKSRATKKIFQATPSFPRPADWGESPRVLPRAHHVHIHTTRVQSAIVELLKKPRS